MNLDKFSSTQKLLIVILVGCVFNVSFFTYQKSIKNDLVSSATSITPILKKEKLNSLLPVRLKIPQIDVDATVEYVGLASDGSVGIPNGPDNVAWFNLGPYPGEVGSSVIDGHAGYKNNRPAVFDNLYKLKKGDKIYVEDSKGTITIFVVRELRTYNPKTNPPEVFISDDGASHLNLITCTGDWNASEKTHSKRLVVFTDKEI